MGYVQPVTPEPASAAGAAEGPQTRYSAPAAACGARLLRLLAREGRALRVPEIAAQLGVSRSLVFRVARELEREQLIRRDAGQRIWLGVGALEVGAAFAARMDGRELLRDSLRALAAAAAATASLGVLRDFDVLFVLREDAPGSSVSVTHAGGRLPASCCALGKALLALRPDDEVAARALRGLVRLTPRSIGDLPTLLAELAETRRRGYAVDEEEAVTGRCCVAASVVLPGFDEPVAFSVSTVSHLFAERRERLLELVLRTRDELPAVLRGQALLGRPALLSDVGHE